MMTGAQRQARYRAAQAVRVAELEAALRIAHCMLARIEGGASYQVAEWDSRMGQIERALGEATARASNGSKVT